MRGVLPQWWEDAAGGSGSKRMAASLNLQPEQRPANGKTKAWQAEPGLLLCNSSARCYFWAGFFPWHGQSKSMELD